MSNFEYDRLYDELLELEKETGTVLAGSPTQKVGYEVLSELPKEAHEAPSFPWTRPRKYRFCRSGWEARRDFSHGNWMA